MGGWLAPALARGEHPSLAPASGLSFHRDVADKIFPIPEGFRTRADQVLRERAALLGLVAKSGRVLGTYVEHGANVTGSRGPTTRAALEESMSQLQMTLEARARFIEECYGLSVDWRRWFSSASRPLRLALELLEGGRPSLSELVARGTARRWLWIVMFSMPYKLRVRAFRWWWGEHPGKRWIRLIARVLHI